jgi:hypothetical protein
MARSSRRQTPAWAPQDLSALRRRAGVSGGRVTNASAIYDPSPGGSQSFANRANSQLSQRILSSQTWNLGRVSGATYAGNAWELSAKDAMSQAGL